MNKKMLHDLQALGVREGGHLLVHSSYKSLGAGAGGISQVAAALNAAVGEGGTLMFPTLTYESVTVSSTHFDVRGTPSCVGAIPEWFRKQPGVKRSLHPTHSVAACGPNAEEITRSHHLDTTPVGENSPFRKLRDAGGQILMLGCGLKPNTSMHGVEELKPPPYLFSLTITYTCLNMDGKPIEMRVKRHHFEDSQGREILQRYDRLKYVLPKDVLTTGNVLDATCYLIEARPMWDIAEAILADDPLFFVSIK